MNLTDRKKAILKSLVDSYIESGEPIGSKYLADSLGFNVSSATIRNEMSELEEMGFLKQPHTSAGRIPTALGYRTYIDSLMERYFLTIEELQILDEVLDYKLKEFGNIMEEASRAISEMTNYASFSILSNADSMVERYDTLYVDDYSFLLIVIFAGGIVRSRHVKFADPVSAKGLERIKTALNHTLAGITAEEISLAHIVDFEEALKELKGLSGPLLRVIYSILGSAESERVHVDGVNRLLSYPEFFNTSKTRNLLEMLDERKKFAKMLKNAHPGRTCIFIGDDEYSEITLPDTGFVFHPISVSGRIIGAIGVIGPKRMDYKKVIASLDYFVSGITETLNEGLEIIENLQSNNNQNGNTGGHNTKNEN